MGLVGLDISMSLDGFVPDGDRGGRAPGVTHLRFRVARWQGRRQEIGWPPPVA
jgi:hypothetical protein